MLSDYCQKCFQPIIVVDSFIGNKYWINLWIILISCAELDTHTHTHTHKSNRPQYLMNVARIAQELTAVFRPPDIYTVVENSVAWNIKTFRTNGKGLEKLSLVLWYSWPFKFRIHVAVRLIELSDKSFLLSAYGYTFKKRRNWFPNFG